MSQQVFQGSQSLAAVVGQEAKIADFDKAFWQHVLEEALDEVLNGEGAKFELAGIGLAVLESDLRFLQAVLVNEANQTAVADSDAVDVRRKIFESRLPITHG